MFHTSLTPRAMAAMTMAALLTLGGAAHAEGTYDWVNAQMTARSTLTRAEVRAQLKAPAAAVPADPSAPVKAPSAQAAAAPVGAAL